MRRIHHREVDFAPIEKSFGLSRLGMLFLFGAVLLPPLALAIGFAEWIFRLPWPILIGFAVSMSIVGFIWLVVLDGMFRVVRTTFRRTNWVMKVSPRELFLQVRHPGNYHFPDDGPTILAIPWQEIEYVRKWVETHDHGHHDSFRIRAFLEIVLKEPEPDEVRSMIQREGTREAPKSRFLGVTSQFRCSRQMVVLAESGVIRVEWLGRGMLSWLRERVKVAPTKRVREIQPLESAEIEARLRELVTRGDLFLATELLRDQVEMSLSEARIYIDELREELTASN